MKKLVGTNPICTAGTVNVRVAWSEWGVRVELSIHDVFLLPR